MSSESFELLLCSNSKQYEHEAHNSNIFWNLSQYILVENSSGNYEKKLNVSIFFSQPKFLPIFAWKSISHLYVWVTISLEPHKNSFPNHKKVSEFHRNIKNIFWISRVNCYSQRNPEIYYFLGRLCLKLK